jgi:ABC-type Na+ efflux pump permease subunit
MSNLKELQKKKVKNYDKRDILESTIKNLKAKKQDLLQDIGEKQNQDLETEDLFQELKEVNEELQDTKLKLEAFNSIKVNFEDLAKDTLEDYKKAEAEYNQKIKKSMETVEELKANFNKVILEEKEKRLNLVNELNQLRAETEKATKGFIDTKELTRLRQPLQQDLKIFRGSKFVKA